MHGLARAHPDSFRTDPGRCSRQRRCVGQVVTRGIVRCDGFATLEIVEVIVVSGPFPRRRTRRYAVVAAKQALALQAATIQVRPCHC